MLSAAKIYIFRELCTERRSGTEKEFLLHCIKRLPRNLQLYGSFSDNRNGGNKQAASAGVHPTGAAFAFQSSTISERYSTFMKSAGFSPDPFTFSSK